MCIRDRPYEQVYKTLVTVSNSKNYFVFVIPIAAELDLKKAAKSVGEKSVEMIHVKDINAITGYIREMCIRDRVRKGAGEKIVPDSPEDGAAYIVAKFKEKHII